MKDIDDSYSINKTNLLKYLLLQQKELNEEMIRRDKTNSWFSKLEETQAKEAKEYLNQIIEFAKSKI